MGPTKISNLYYVGNFKCYMEEVKLVSKTNEIHNYNKEMNFMKIFLLLFITRWMSISFVIYISSVHHFEPCIRWYAHMIPLGSSDPNHRSWRVFPDYF